MEASGTGSVSSWGRIPAIGPLMIGAAVALFVAVVFSLFVDFDNFDTSVTTSPSFLISSVLYLLGGIVLLLALVRLYTEQAPTLGWFGLLAFAVAFIGGALTLGALWADFFLYPYLADEAPSLATEDPTGWLLTGFLISFGLTALGWLLVGVALLRSHVVALWVAVLVIVGALASLVPGIGGLVFFAAIAVLGFSLSKGPETVPGPRHAGSPAPPTT